jgi:hypothetical protein
MKSKEKTPDVSATAPRRREQPPTSDHDLRDNGFTLRCFSQSNISRRREHQLPRKGYFKIPRSHSREDLLVGEIFRSMSTTVRLLPRLGMRIQPPRNQRLVRSSDRMNRDGPQSGSREVCPERQLAVAVLSQAADDLRKFRHARRGAGYSLYADARNWITSNDRKWPYSFLNLCDVLNLAADAIRAELLGSTSGHPSLKSRTT